MEYDLTLIYTLTLSQSRTNTVEMMVNSAVPAQNDDLCFYSCSGVHYDRSL